METRIRVSFFFRYAMHFSFFQLAEKLDRPCFGEDLAVRDFTTPEEADAHDIILLSDKKYLKMPESLRSKAWLIAEPLITESVSDFLRRSGISYITTRDPKADLITLMQLFFPAEDFIPFRHESAVIGNHCVIDPDTRIEAFTVIEDFCSIGKGTHIHANCVIGRNAQIGNHVIIYPNVTVYSHSVIGDRVIIHSGTVIGSDGFGYHKQDGRYRKIPHAGRAVIGDDAEIGSNCCIDRGTLGDTKIGSGCKLDNLIQIAHNVVIGENTVIAAQAGISGSTIIGDSVTIAGQAGLVGHIVIGSHATIGAQAGVIGSVDDGTTVSGYPAREHSFAMKREALISKIPDILEQIRALKKNRT